VTATASARTFGPIELEGFSAPPELCVPRHGHDGVHFTLVGSGAFEELVGDRHLLSEGQLRLAPCGDEHRLQFGKAGGACVIVALPPEWFREASGGRIPDARRRGQDPRVGEWLRQLGEALDLAGPESPLLVEGVALELVAWSQPAGRATGLIPGWLLDLRDALHEDDPSGLSLTLLGRRAGRHPVYVARAFRRHFGRSIGAYVRDLRVVQASRRLSAGQQPLVELAGELGFSDQAHFTRWVKRRLGATPGEIRRRARA
jgi:AraC family transcriptional regulator